MISIQDADALFLTLHESKLKMICFDYWAIVEELEI